MTDDTKQAEKLARYACASIAAAEYAYWKHLPHSDDAIVEAMQVSAMAAAANICAAIFLGKSPQQHATDLASGRPLRGGAA